MSDTRDLQRVTTFLRASQLVHGLFRALDAKDDEAAGSFFAPKGTWLRQGRLLTGPAEVAAVLSQREQDRRSIHVVSNLSVILNAERKMVATYYLTGYVGSRVDSMQLSAILDCSDELIEVNGELKIAAKTSRKLL